MDSLPIEIVYSIFSLLEYRPLASAAKVCRTWRHLTDSAELWKTLYERRWGPTKEATADCTIASASQSWKAAYEIHDRWDRIGEDMTIIREGDDYFLAQKGRLLRFLGSCNRRGTNKKVEDQQLPGMVADNPHAGSPGTTARAGSFSPAGTRSFNPGLLDKMIRFVGDLDHEQRRLSKRAHVTSI
ncbi:hypothetical protein R1flu_007733 [Riccia fluitans]|uniref:F-box domain-containing protein n=1 Tax=Riccia fluitans TaxID=41844 RepID=A0ABD1Z0W6_9MARC